MGHCSVESRSAQLCESETCLDTVLLSETIPVVIEEAPGRFYNHFAPDITVNATRSVMTLKRLIGLKCGSAGEDCEV